jgi:putative two-component system response regulator
MALADVYDALISKRVYKEAYPHAEAVDDYRQRKREAL